MPFWGKKEPEKKEPEPSQETQTPYQQGVKKGQEIAAGYSGSVEELIETNQILLDRANEALRYAAEQQQHRQGRLDGVKSVLKKDQQ